MYIPPSYYVLFNACALCTESSAEVGVEGTTLCRNFLDAVALQAEQS